MPRKFSKLKDISEIVSDYWDFGCGLTGGYMVGGLDNLSLRGTATNNNVLYYTGIGLTLINSLGFFQEDSNSRNYRLYRNSLVTLGIVSLNTGGLSSLFLGTIFFAGSYFFDERMIRAREKTDIKK